MKSKDLYEKLSVEAKLDRLKIYKKIEELLKEFPPYTEEELQNRILSDEDEKIMNKLFPRWKLK